MKKLKIFIISLKSLPLYDESYNTENVMGGTEINLYNLALFLSRMEYIDVKVLVDDYGQPAVYRKDNIELIRFDSPGAAGGLTGKLAALRSWRQLFSLDADVFIFSTGHALLGKLVLLQKFIKGKKVLFRMSSDYNAELKLFRKENGLKSFLSYRFGLMNASAVISQTEKQRCLLKKKLGISSFLIPNGFFIRDTPDLKNKRHILWVGRCLESKRPLVFLELAERLPEEEFVMIMPINKGTAPEYRQLDMLAEEVASRVKLLGNVKLIDYVAYNEIQAYFDNAKLYICTSELEGFPNTFIQACLGGTPILTYRVNPDDIIGKYRLGCFCDDNTEKAAAFIRNLTPSLAVEYKERLMRYALQNHNITDTAQKFLALIDKGPATEVSAVKGG